MVGALVATMIRVQFAWKPKIGDLTVNIQDSANMILPRLLPLVIVFLIYWLLGRKNEFNPCHFLSDYCIDYFIRIRCYKNI